MSQPTTPYQRPFVVGVTGGSGSGKTTLIREIRKKFDLSQVCIISMDDYYLPRDEQHTDDNGEKNFDLPKSFDKKEFRKDLLRLMDGEIVERQEYTFNNEKKQAGMHTYHPAPVIIVEGLFLFHFKKIAPIFDLKVFINAKENLKVIRRIYRDRVERNYPLEDVLYKYEHHVLPSFEKYIEPYREEADIVINNNKTFERGLAVLLGYLHGKLADKRVE
jgi:uridine kinase